MASVKVKLRESKIPGKEGKLFIQVIHKREIKVIPTKLKVLSSEWDSINQRIVADEEHMFRLVDLFIIEKELQRILDYIDDIIYKLELRGEYTVTDIVDEYTGKIYKKLFFEFMQQRIDELNHEGSHTTAIKYQGALRQYRLYRNGQDIFCDSIDEQEINGLERYFLKKGMTLNSVSFYLRILRAVYYKAVHAGYAPERKPFKDVYTGVAKTEKRAIDEKIIKKLQKAKLKPRLAFARDMFLFSFYTRGMSYVDIANLKKENYVNRTITYKRNKTGQILTIGLEPCAIEIIDRYAAYCADSDNLLPITIYNGKKIKYASAIQSQNERLKAVSKQLTIDPPLTSYVARHTWATIARRKGVDVAVISAGMGHTSEKTTHIYLSSFEQDVLDQANKKVISNKSKK